MSSDTPNAEMFQNHRVTNPAQSEVIRQRFYDYLLYPAAGQQQFTFFSQPIGQGVTSAIGGTVGTGKTAFDTNLELPNTLPSGKAYMIESIEVYFAPGSSAVANTFTSQSLGNFAVAAGTGVMNSFRDVDQFYNSGLLELNVLSKNYLRETPMLAFPPKTYLGSDGGIATNSATVGALATGRANAMGRPYYVDPKISLQASVNFEVLIRYPAAVPTISTNNGRVGVILDGYLMRASQ